MKLKYSAKAHGYWLDGKRCKSPSAIAKVPDDTNALTGWKLRQVALGIASAPDKFLTEVSAHSNDKEALDGICQQAIDASGGGSGRDRGSALHLITEKLDAGIDLFDTPLVVETRRVWNHLLDTYGLKVVHSEGVVVHPELKIAGRFDRIVTDGTNLYVLDIKGGADADKYVHAHCVQLWLYASAPLMAELPVGDTDFEVTDFAPMPAVSQELGLIAHIPIEGEPRIIGIDIAAGGQCFEDVIKPIWGWRARRDLVSEFKPQAPAPEPTHSTGYAINFLLTRIDAIKAHKPAFDQLLSTWPTGVPTPKNSGQWAEGEIEQIINAVAAVERDHSLPFLPEPFEAPPTAPVVDNMITVATVAEGGLDADDAARIIDIMRTLGPMMAQANAWAAQARDAGTSLSISQLPSKRRRHIATAITAVCLANHEDHDGFMRQCLNLVMDSELQDTITTGAALGALTISEAERLETLTCA